MDTQQIIDGLTLLVWLGFALYIINRDAKRKPRGRHAKGRR